LETSLAVASTVGNPQQRAAREAPERF